MFSDHIRKSVTQTLNTHLRRHPLQTESIDVDDDNALLQLGRLGVAPKNARKSSESLTSGDDDRMDIDLDDGDSAKKKDSSKTGDKRKGKNPFQPVKKGKLLALRQKSVDASNILGELRSPSRTSGSDNDVWEQEHSKGEPNASVSEKPNNKVQVKIGKEKTGKINKDKFSVFGELAVNKSPKHLEKRKEKNAVDVDLISWMKDKNEVTSLGKPSAIKAEDANKVKEKNAKFTDKKSQNERSSTGDESPLPIPLDVECEGYTVETIRKRAVEKKEDRIEVIEEIETKDIVPLMLNDMQAENEQIEKENDPDIEKSIKSEIKRQAQDNGGDKRDSAPLTLKMNLEEKNRVMMNIPIDENACENESFSIESSIATNKIENKSSKHLSLKKSVKNVVTSNSETSVKISKEQINSKSEKKTDLATTKRVSDTSQGNVQFQSKSFSLNVTTSKSSQDDSSAVIIPQSTRRTSGDGTEMMHSEDDGTPRSSPSPSKGMWKTFKRSDRMKKGNVVEKNETAEDKKKRFKESRSQSMAVPSVHQDEEAVTSEVSSADKTGTRPKLTRSLTDIGRQDSLEELKNEMEEILNQRAVWKKEANTATKNKLSKMIVKTKAAWKSYEADPGQLDYDKYYKMKEKHKERMREKKRIKEVETGSLDMEKFNGIEKIDEHKENMDIAIRERERKAEEMKETRRKQKIQRDEEKKQKLIEEEKQEIIKKEEEKQILMEERVLTPIVQREEEIKLISPQEKEEQKIYIQEEKIESKDEEKTTRESNHLHTHQEDLIPKKDTATIDKSPDKQAKEQFEEQTTSLIKQKEKLEETTVISTKPHEELGVVIPTERKEPEHRNDESKVPISKDKRGFTELPKKNIDPKMEVDTIQDTAEVDTMQEPVRNIKNPGNDSMAGKNETVESIPEKIKDGTIVNTSEPSDTISENSKENETNSRGEKIRKLRRKTKGMEDKSLPLPKQFKGIPEQVNKRNEPTSFSEEVANCIPAKGESDKIDQQENIKTEKILEKNENDVLSDQKASDKTIEIKNPSLTRQERVRKLLEERKEKKESVMRERKKLEESIKSTKSSRREQIKKLMEETKENEDPANVEKTPQNLTEPHKDENIFIEREKSEVQVQQQDMDIAKPLENLKENNQNHSISKTKEDEKKIEKDQHIEKVNLEKITTNEKNKKVDDLFGNDRENIKPEKNEKHPKDKVNTNQTTRKTKIITEPKKDTVFVKNDNETKEIDMMGKEEKQSDIPLRNANLEQKIFNSPSLSKYSNEDLRCIGPAVTLKGSMEENDMKKRFFRASGDPYSYSKSEILERYDSLDDKSVTKDEWKSNVINKICNRVGAASPAYLDMRDETWNLLASGEQGCGKNVPSNMDMESTVIEFKKSKMDNAITDDEAWILVARGLKRHSEHDAFQINELIEKEETWFSIAQGSELSDQKENRLRKLSHWSKRQDTREKHSWDMDNMPIQNDEFIHFDRKQKESFETKVL